MKDLNTTIQQAMGGDLDAFSDLVLHFQKMAVAYAFSIVADFELAEDAAQEAFIRVYRNLGKLRNSGALPAWLRRVVRNQCLNLVRSKHIATVGMDFAEGKAADQPSPAEELERRELTDTALDAIRGLPPKQREVTTLYYIDGYSQKEISDFLNVPIGAVKARLHAARENLRGRVAAMLASQLKQSKPGKEFLGKVMRQIRDIKVSLPESLIFGSAERPIVLLKDEKGNFCHIYTEPTNAEALSGSLGRRSSGETGDIHGWLAGVLDWAGCKISKVLISGAGGSPQNSIIDIKRGRKTFSVNAIPGDSLNLAVRCQCPVHVTEGFLAERTLKGQDGRPVSRAEALRIAKSMMPPALSRPPALGKALSDLRRNPDSRQVRSRLMEALTKPKGRNSRMFLYDFRKLAHFEKWVEDQKGTGMEGTAMGLLGAAFLKYLRRRPDLAMPCLERAYALRPDDALVATDLATAYAVCGHEAECRRVFQDSRPALSSSGHTFKEFWKAVRLAEIAENPKQSGGFPEMTKALRKSIESQIGKEGLVGLESYHWVPNKAGRSCIALRTEHGEGLLIQLNRPEHFHAYLGGLSGSSYGSFLVGLIGALLDGAGIKAESLVLSRRSRSRVKAALLLKQGAKDLVTEIDAYWGLIVSRATKCPVFATKALAEEIAMRGDATRPLAWEAAVKHLEESTARPPDEFLQGFLARPVAVCHPKV